MDVNAVETVEQKLNRLYTEGVKIKSDERADRIWQPEFDETLESLQELIDMTEYGADVLDPTIIETSFEEMEIAKFETFKLYMASKNIESAQYFNHSTRKVQMNRTTSKTNRCKKCNHQTEIEGDKIVCQNPKCGHIEEIKITALQKTTNDKMKHLKDKLKMIAGLKDPPKKIVNLLSYIKVWLTDLSYLYEWLHYKEKFVITKNPFTFKNWIAEFRKIYVPKGDSKTWEMKVEDKEQYAWTFPEFKLIIIELFYMLAECERRNKVELTQSNVEALEDDEIYEIFEEYHSVYPELPKPKETFEINNEIYEVGNYINSLALMNEKSEISERLETLFGAKIKVPGLMFNFKTHPKVKPDRHVFTESYSYIIHNVFNISFDDVPLTLNIIDQISSIIEDFDAWVRETAVKGKIGAQTHKNNSKLYVCKIKNILELPYFNKYSGIYKYFPVKSEETAGSITTSWLEYTSIEPYKSKIKQYEEVV